MAEVHYLRPSATYTAHFYRGFVIEPTPLGRWVLYREGPEAADPVDAGTVDDAVRKIDTIIDGGDPDALRTKDVLAAIAVGLLFIAMVLWLPVSA